MRNVARILLVGAMAAAAVGFSAGSAVADPITPASWTVSPGGSANASAGVTTLTDIDTGVQLTCDSSSLTGAQLVTSATGSPAQLGTLPAGSVGFQNCSGPFGLNFDVEHVGNWALNGVTFDPATGITAGTLTNIRANLSGFACTATVVGSVNGTYNNSTGVLRILPNPTLTVEFVDDFDDCFGLINEGDRATFDGAYTVSPRQTITGRP
jgi:hypothetical protein